MPRRRPFTSVTTILLATSVFWPLAADPPAVRLVERAVLDVEVQPLLIVEGQSGALASRRVDVDPERGGEVEFRLQWPDPSRSTRLTCRLSGQAGPEGGDSRLDASAVLEFPGGERTKAERTFRVRDGGTELFEIYRDERQGLTLALRVHRKVLGLGVAGREVGDRIAFRLGVDGVRGERMVELETNYLNTFVGDTVEYSFRRGDGESGESVQLLMTPVRRHGDIVEVMVEIAGSLPGVERRLLLSRKEILITTRGATSSVTVTNGDPPAGYRFRVTPLF